MNFFGGFGVHVEVENTESIAVEVFGCIMINIGNNHLPEMPADFFGVFLDVGTITYTVDANQSSMEVGEA